MLSRLNLRANPLGLRLLFSAITLIIIVMSAFNAYNILVKFRVSNDQCAWVDIPERRDAFIIEDIVPGGVADEAGLRNGDILLKINGQAITSDNTDTTKVHPMNIINAMSYGEYADYLIERNGNTLNVKVKIIKVYDIAYIANLLLGIMFLFVGFVVVMTKPLGKTQRQFYYYSAFVMLGGSLSSFNINFVQGNQFLFILFYGLILLTRSVAPVYFISFFSYFPVYKKSKYFNYIFGTILAANLIFSLFILIPDQRINIDSPYRFMFVNSLLSYFVIGLIVFTFRYFKLTDKVRRKQLKPILYSSIVSIASYIYIIYLNANYNMAIFLKPYLLLPSLLIITLPIAFGYSIFRYRLMDFEIVVKKSIIYGTITATIAAFYVLFVFGAGSLVGEFFGQEKNETLSIIAILIIAFIFDPLKRFLQDWVDRVFYRERYNYQQMLLEFSKTLPLQKDMQNILNSVVDKITETMHIEKMAVIIFDKNGRNVFASRNIPEILMNFNGYSDGLINIMEKAREPQNIRLMRDEHYKFRLNEKELIMLEQSGIELTVPMFLKDRLIGVINAGRKKSESYFSQEDINLLSTVASQAAIAIENARLYEKERSLEKVQHEMNLASQIQLEWLPKESPDINNYEIAGKTLPAEVVGGDYFDFIHNNDKLVISIGDVSGKGLPAALLMANLQAILRSQANISCQPKECISHINRTLYKSTRDDMFVTLFYGVLLHEEHQLIYTNAGHNYPMLVRKDGRCELLDAGGLIIGVEHDAVYEEKSISFYPGDILILYSDGLSEAMDDNGNIYGEERLLELVKRYRHDKPSSLIRKVISKINEYTGSSTQMDDMTMIICKRKEI